VSALARVLNNTTIASASWDCTVTLWNTATGEQVNTLHGLPGPISCMAVHPEGQVIVYGFWDGSLQVYDVLHQKSLFKLERHRASVRAVSFTPSGRHIFSSCSMGSVKVWSMLSGKQVGSFQGNAGPLNGLSFSADGHLLRTVGQDGQVRWWSGHLGALKHVLTTQNKVQCRSVAFSADQELVAVAYNDGSLRIFSTVDGRVTNKKYKAMVLPFRCRPWERLRNCTRRASTASSGPPGSPASW